MLKNAPPFGEGCHVDDKLWRRLIICYNDLSHEECEMFLDIAHFLSKEHSSKFGGVWTRQRRITVQRAL
jgi:hypothetical protein